MEIVECRLCGSNELTMHFIARGQVLLRCLECGFVQVKLKPDDEQLKSIYSDVYFNHAKYSDDFTLNKEHSRRLSLLKKFIVNSSGKILDVGCASGEFINYSKSFFEWWGIDISDYAVEQAKSLNPELKDRFSAGMIENQTFPKNSFDGIVLWDALEHLWDPKEICRSLLTYLKPGGYLFISTPNIGSFTSRIMGKSWAFMTPPEHLSFFSKNNIKYLFETLLNSSIISWSTKGKWVNFSFLLYKIRRINPLLVHAGLIKFFRTGFLKKFSLYVPTGDIQYLVIKKDAV